MFDDETVFSFALYATHMVVFGARCVQDWEHNVLGLFFVSPLGFGGRSIYPGLLSAPEVAQQSEFQFWVGAPEECELGLAPPVCCGRLLTMLLQVLIKAGTFCQGCEVVLIFVEKLLGFLLHHFSGLLCRVHAEVVVLPCLQKF
jgi:hypothetical protein